MSATNAEDGRTARAREAREARELQIVDAALRVFAEKGYHQASITDLVEAAGVARGTFYLYFTSKQAVFVELLERLFVAFRATVAGVDMTPGADPLRSQLVAIVQALLEAARASEAVTAVLFREAAALEPEIGDKIREHEAAFLGWISASLANGTRLGLLRPHDPELAAVMVYGSVRHVIERVIPTADDVGAIAAALVDHHLAGLRAPEPR